ncbi:unnamed protein product [Arctogadus glacialis]
MPPQPTPPPPPLVRDGELCDNLLFAHECETRGLAAVSEPRSSRLAASPTLEPPSPPLSPVGGMGRALGFTVSEGNQAKVAPDQLSLPPLVGGQWDKQKVHDDEPHREGGSQAS